MNKTSNIVQMMSHLKTTGTEKIEQPNQLVNKKKQVMTYW